MADQPRYPESGDDTPPERGSRTGTPRWVKVSGIVALILVVLVVVLKVAGLGGEHGPDRHSPAGESNNTSDTSGGHAGPPPGITHTQP